MRRALTTIITRAYLPHARLIAREYRRHHPDGRFIVLVADLESSTSEVAEEPFEVWTLAELGHTERVREMTFIYTAFELSCALRGLFHLALGARGELDSWLFIDGDVFVVGELSPVFEEIEENSITLSQHARTPAFPEARPIPEVELLTGGVFNGGVLGLRNDGTSARFAQWFSERLHRHALAEPPTFVDQLWLNLVPGLFEGVGTFRHPGVNVGHWNLHERALAASEKGEFLIGDAPLLLAHLSGVDLEDPTGVSRHAPWFAGRAPAPWSTLIERYRDGLAELGGAEAGGVEYGFSRYRAGKTIPLRDRRAYRAALLGGRGPIGSDPFARPVSRLERLRHTWRGRVRRWRGLPPTERA